tara:strand:+ start:201 stop:545 length:345 start_codon:yes stop_codon:yes gene_type:complete
MKRKETLIILFDQNAGKPGRILDFFDKPCSCTTLPDILHKKFNPRFFIVYTHRKSYLRSDIKFKEIHPSGNESPIVIANRWLEEMLTIDSAIRESWLWLHDRWKIRGRKSNNRQ